MKADEVLCWLHQARNVIVKQKDLELHSVATARVRAWEDASRLEFQISPFITTEQIAKDLIRLHVVKAPEPIADYAILSVERKWVVNDLSHYELLDVIAHGYKFFQELLFDAHEKAKLNMHLCREQYDPKHESPFTPCMSITRDDRSVNVKLKTGEIFAKVAFDDLKGITDNPRVQEKIKERYAGIKPALPECAGDIFELGRILNERAKQMLAIDGTHATIFFLYYPDGGCNILAIQPDDQSEKYVLIRTVADQVTQTKASGVIAISEVWAILEEERSGYKLPAEHPSRKEALQVTIVNKEKIRILITFFTRNKEGAIELDKTQTEKVSTYKLLEPIIEALKVNNL